MKQLYRFICPHPRQYALRTTALALCLASFAAAPGSAQTLTAAPAETQALPPLERHPGRLFNFTTAHQLQAGGLQLHVGTHQTDPDYTPRGTGNQIYHGGVDWGVSERVQLSLGYQYFEDPVSEPINGLFPEIRFATFSASAKFSIYKGERLTIAANGSVEYLTFASNIFGSRGGLNSDHMVASLHVPLSYALSPALEVHVTPGVSVFPDSINGTAFYGTVPSLGLGFSWRPNQRWLTYGAITAPFGPGGNTISSTGTITRQPIWTAGLRYNITPKTAVDLYVTNGIGATPATNILSFFPKGTTPLFGARILYTPGRSPGYRPNYRGISDTPLSPRNRALQLDGFTLTSADTLSAGTIAASAQYGDYGNQGAGLFFSPDHDGQIEVIGEQYAVDGSIGRTRTPSDSARYMVGAKLRLMDQNNGSPFSLSVRALLGRDTSARLNGVFYIGVAASYKASPRLAITVNPKAAAFAKITQYGLGLGVNYQLMRDLQVIAEVTPVANGHDTVWAAGLRYQVPKTAISLDLHATNAIGRYGLGTLVAQAQTKIAFGATMQLGLRRR